ncbi:unnamed protein product [Orchesella dallaii]|uniref:CHK kinase-like domain-containing protein n=1 Tax=Orchesella dallaii TaxID=48710 RepID=A0ABP1RCL3_9HEXA
MPPVPKLDVEETPNEATLKYKRIVKANGIHDEVSEVIVKHSGLQGAGMSSQQLYVTVKFVDLNINPLNLFVKAHTTNSHHSELIDGFRAFEKESRFFTEYIPAAREFCKSKGHEGLLDFYPKCYYGDENSIVFENLVLDDKGYTLLDAGEKQDMEAVRFAITNLAKHHAISYAFIKELGGPGPFLTQFPTLDFEAFTSPKCRAIFEPVVKNSIASNIQILERTDVPGSETAVKQLKSIQDKSFDMAIKAIELYDSEEEKLFLLNHGDYWNNNMMFQKDKATGRITGQIAIDLQVTRYNSLGLDVGYYLYTSVKPNVRRSHWQEILEMYLTTLKETVEKLGHPIDLSYEELLLIIRKKIDLGFWFAMGFTNEAGIAAFKEINMNEVGSMVNFSDEFDKWVQKWIEKNPQKVKETAEELVKLMEEYNELLIK